MPALTAPKTEKHADLSESNDLVSLYAILRETRAGSVERATFPLTNVSETHY